MRIGILGCGYVGQAAALQWKKEGYYLTATTRKPERIPFLKSITQDVYLINEQTFASFIQQQDALLISVAPDTSLDYTSTYLKTAQQVASTIRYASHLQQIIYTSSTSVYGDLKGGWVNEDISIHHLDHNRQILYETEQVLFNLASDQLHVCILRLGEIYGPGREIEERLRRMQHQTFAGDGESYTNLIHLNDIVRALHFALEHQLQGIYNLCNDFHIPRKQFYQDICQKEHISPIHWDSSKQSLRGGNRRVSNQKIKTAGFTFKYPYYFN